MLEPDRTFARRDTALFVFCVALSVGALFAPEPWQYAAASAARSTALAPLIALQRIAEASRTSRTRFDALTAERDSAAVAAQSLPVLLDENAQLRALLDLARRVSPRPVPAEVLHQSLPTDARMLLIGSGRAAGIMPFQPVVSPDGLIGLVRTAGASTALVMTWAHPDFRASAVTLDGSVTGLVGVTADATIREPMLELRGVPYRDSVAVGTPVITSGLGGVFPRGLNIGTVVGVARQSEGWERIYLVRPAAAPARVSHVLVLLGGGVPQPAAAEDSLP
ncbi:MAG TPA: rod shape-determining protein MreC [Gemmatimonadales bacterium]|jgi:rod shape-determining protein MreC|nr:rod shape-determining protein MreC [Gemmatimonadales bacterium]